MNVWTLVPCEADKTNLARLPGFHGGLHPTAFGKNAVRIGIANHFMKLEQVNPIRLQPPQRFIELSCCSSFISTIDFGHQKGLLAITIAQRFAHSNFALSAVVVPAVIEKIDSFIDSRANDPNALVGIALVAQVIPTEPDQ